MLTGIRLYKWYIHSTFSDTFTNPGIIVIAVIITRTINGDFNFADSTITNVDDNIFPNKTTIKYNNATCPIVTELLTMVRKAELESCYLPIRKTS